MVNLKVFKLPSAKCSHILTFRICSRSSREDQGCKTTPGALGMFRITPVVQTRNIFVFQGCTFHIFPYLSCFRNFGRAHRSHSPSAETALFCVRGLVKTRSGMSKRNWQVEDCLAETSPRDQPSHQVLISLCHLCLKNR